MFLFIMSNDNVKIRLCIKRPRICVHFHRNLNQVCILFNIYISLHSLIYIHILLCKKYVCLAKIFAIFGTSPNLKMAHYKYERNCLILQENHLTLIFLNLHCLYILQTYKLNSVQTNCFSCFVFKYLKSRVFKQSQFFQQKYVQIL